MRSCSNLIRGFQVMSLEMHFLRPNQLVPKVQSYNGPSRLYQFPPVIPKKINEKFDSSYVNTYYHYNIKN